MPSPIKSPDEPWPSVECFLDLSFTQPGCRDGFVVQLQSFGVEPGGGLSGSLCALVLLEVCAGSCATSDAGAAYCPDGYADAGPSVDAGPVACCQASGYPGWSKCRLLGGVKQPPHGCRIVCCQGCGWMEGKDSFGCTTWTPVPQDGGVDA